MILKVKNAKVTNWDEIRYWVEFEVNGQKLKIGTTWNDGKCSFDDVIAHRGYSGENTVPHCSYCGRSFTDCEICPEFYFNSVKTQIIADQLVVMLEDELKELPFNFEKPFIDTNRGQKLLDLIRVAKERGDKIAGIFDDYERYMVSGSLIAPNYDDPELLEDDDWFYIKTSYKVVDVPSKSERIVTDEGGLFESDEILSYLVPEELLSRSNEFLELEAEWKIEKVLEAIQFSDLYHRRNSDLTFLRSMIAHEYPKDGLFRFVTEYLSVDMLEDVPDIREAFNNFLEDERVKKHIHK